MYKKLTSWISNPKIQLRVVTNASAFQASEMTSSLGYDSTHILKQDSKAIVVMGILNMSLAITLKEGNRFEFSFHQVKISKSKV